jgi:hypothetical protein
MISIACLKSQVLGLLDSLYYICSRLSGKRCKFFVDGWGDTNESYALIKMFTGMSGVVLRSVCSMQRVRSAFVQRLRTSFKLAAPGRSGGEAPGRKAV